MRLKIKITGLVQGVGFRPFVYRLAKEAGLTGYVLNDTEGVKIEVEGQKEKLDDFLIRLEKEKPAISKIYSLQHSFLPASRFVSLQSGQGGENAGFKDFEIRKSQEPGDKKAPILPDISVCNECLKDINTPSDRRYMYPFTNCTNCGPRFTIIEDIPYDRKNTSMKSFSMCPDCEAEYSLPSDRRFHAQPDACSVCGPSVCLYNEKGELILTKDSAIKKTIDLINEGLIIAIKGIGGYHLVCDAADKTAVDRLRKRKHREEKPMAVMFPDLSGIKAAAYTDSLEERALNSIEKPIVILKKKETAPLADSVSPDNGTIGAFLPYTPLHHIILQAIKKPVIATSANMTDEPIVKDNADAFERLSDITDYTLSHNRHIVRRCDDSVVRITAQRQVPLRRSRGFAPLAITLPFKINKPVLCLGPYMNNTIAVGIDDKVFMSQHIGDLDTPLATDFYEETINDFLKMFDVKPEVVVSDMHPGYYSTRFGEKHYKNRLTRVQHHFAHIISCMAENDLPGGTDVIGFSFDGTGYGMDKTIWGGEVLIASYKKFRRAFHLRPYKLPGGDKAVKEPFRTALSLLFETFGENAAGKLSLIPENERLFFIEMIKKNINSPVTTSMGRLFDGVASIINLKQRISYHAQAAISLEQCALKSDATDSYRFSIENSIIDYRPLIKNIVNDLKSGVSCPVIAKKFHNSIVDIILSISGSLKKETGISTVALSGGVFQNTILLENTFNALKENGFTPIIHQLVPANDGGISLGQAVYSQFL